MHLTFALEQSGLLERLPGDTEPNHSLDELCHRFGVAPHDRHTAMGDAFLTGQVLLKLLGRASRGGLRTIEQLVHGPAIQEA